MHIKSLLLAPGFRLPLPLAPHFPPSSQIAIHTFLLLSAGWLAVRFLGVYCWKFAWAFRTIHRMKIEEKNPRLGHGEALTLNMHRAHSATLFVAIWLPLLSGLFGLPSHPAALHLHLQKMPFNGCCCRDDDINSLFHHRIPRKIRYPILRIHTLWLQRRQHDDEPIHSWKRTCSSCRRLTIWQSKRTEWAAKNGFAADDDDSVLRFIRRQQGCAGG